MTSSLFIEYPNWLHNRRVIQQLKILLFLDSYPNHIPVKLSNMAIKLLLKNIASRLQPIDQDTIALLKRTLSTYIMGDILTAMMASENVTDLAKKVTTFDDILNTKVVWDAVAESIIFK